MKRLPFPVWRLALGVAACVTALPLMAQERRVSPAQLQSYWILLNRTVDVDLPIGGKNLTQPGCVAVTFDIGSDGKTRNQKVAKVVPESGLGKAGLSAVKNFRYGPSLNNRNGEPVSTYYVVPFNSPTDKTAQAALMAPCKLPGYDQA